MRVAGGGAIEPGMHRAHPARALATVQRMDEGGFGACTNHGSGRAG